MPVENLPKDVYEKTKPKARQKPVLSAEELQEIMEKNKKIIILMKMK